MSIGQRLLGMFQTQPDQYQTLLGEYYDPKTAKMKWLGGTLQGLGMGLASGQPGAWATGLTQGGGQAVDDYRKQAMLGYQAGQQAEDKAYGREQDAKTWDWREKQAAQDQARWETEQARLAQAQKDQAAWQNLVRQNTLKGWQEADALRQGQTNAVNAWTNNFKSQGGDLFSPEMQTGLRAQGVQGVDPMDTMKFRQAQPFAQAGDVGSAFGVLSAPSANAGASNLPKGYRMKADGSGAEPIPGVVLPGAPKPYTPNAGDRTAVRNMKEENALLAQTLANLDEAAGLVNNANSGYLSTGRAAVAENMPDWMVPDSVFGSPKQGADTLRLKQIMDAEALASMGKLLKGPTSDRDVKIMLETVNDPNASAKRKQAAIDQVKRTIQAQIAANEDNINFSLNGPQNGGGGAITTPDGYIIEPVE